LININLPLELAKFIANQSYTYPTYLSVGDSSTAETESDIALGNELYRTTVTISSEGVLVKQLTNIPSTATALYTKTIRESGTFSASSGGTLFDRSVSATGIGFDAATEVKITKFMAFDNSGSGISYMFTDDGINELILALAGSGGGPSYIAWSSDLILEKCDAIGVGPNDWTDNGSAATTPTLYASNVTEGTGSIKLGKDGVGSAVFSYKKDLAATINCSSVTKFYLDLNIEDSLDLAKLKTTGCIQVRIGSSSANYKYYSFDNSSLIVGWQTLEITVSGMSDNGAPDMSIVDYLGLFMETINATDVITHGNLIMDYWRGFWNISGSDTTLHNENFRDAITNPIRTNLSVFLTSNMGLTEGNTYNYKFTGVFNAAAAGDLYFVFKSFDEVKSNVSQITSDITIMVGIYGYSS